MLNLRQLNNADNTKTNSDTQHPSRFSIDFRVPSDLLGNIGEPLDYSQSEQLHEDEPGEREVVAEESEASASTDLESAEPVAGPSGARWEDEDRAPVCTQATDTVAGSSVTRWGENGRASPESTVPSAATSGTRGDEVGDTSHALDYVRCADTGEEVRLSLCLYYCSPKLRMVSFVGAGDQR